MKKNLFDIDYNKSTKACDPCASECKRISRKINGRKLSELKKKEVKNLLHIFEVKN